jgi:hypothetical protein
MGDVIEFDDVFAAEERVKELREQVKAAGLSTEQLLLISNYGEALQKAQLCRTLKRMREIRRQA